MNALHIAWKDTLTRFRDWKALIGLLGAPLIISGLIGLAFGNIGGFGGSDSPIRDIEIIVVNQDDGVLGENYVEVLSSPDLDELLNVRYFDDLGEARQEIEAGNARAVVFIPEDFSNTLIPTDSQQEAENASATVELYTDPAANISPFIIESIVEQITAGANTILLASTVATDEVINYAEILGPSMANLSSV